jgi:TfoX/Sxy family transcriptional regulator of competence genes
MTSDVDFVQFVADQMSPAGAVSDRKMFGDYGIYCNGTIVGLICGNPLFMYSTETGRQFLGLNGGGRS